MERKETGRFDGYASVFNTLDLNNDIVFAGAFQAALTKAKRLGKKIPLLWSHHPQDTIGYCDILTEDTYGLRLQGEIFLNTSRGRSLFNLIKKKKLSGLSIGYIPRCVAYSKHRKVRCLKEVDLLEISIVTTPANPKAKIFAAETSLPQNKIGSKMEKM